MEKGYALVYGSWKRGDHITLDLSMEDRVLMANSNVSAKSGLLAVQYGPLVYCGEELDNEVDVLEVKVGVDAKFEVCYSSDLLGGVNMLKSEELNLVPYYAWANRKVGKMNVWFTQK
jgi:DUF1680 family protein